MPPILPGATIGFLGGGQLGRMAAMAARSLGYGVVVMDPHADCPASALADRTIVADFDDATAAAELARSSDVVTYEIEKIGPEALVAAGEHAALRPSPAILQMVQDRARQKSWLIEHGFPVGPYREAAGAEEISRAARELGVPCRAKARTGGYDGRGQARVATPEDASQAIKEIGSTPCVVEAELDLEYELSVLVARRPSGEVSVYRPARNWHVSGILDESVLPGDAPKGPSKQAMEHASRMAELMELEGLLAVEFFLTRDGTLFVNELAPRPHNTYHTSEWACETSQFEQLVRAICDLPLGSPEVIRPSALFNLLGDLWLNEEQPPFEAILNLEGVHLRLYGKEPRPARKVGHLVATASTPQQALARMREARQLVGG